MTVAPIKAAFFWSKVKVEGSAMCWPWQAGRKGKGYGNFRGALAHRIAYQMHRGPIPEGLLVRHICGNKLCVNPAHLEVGTVKDNAQDGIRLGEILRGSRNGRSKISDANARYILANPDNMTGNAMAAKFGVSKATVSLIRSGKRWAHAQHV